jgi:hypothetical protein
MKNLFVAALVAAVVTVGSSVFACGGGSPVTMTVSTTATFDPVPTNYVPTQDGSCTDDVM